MKRTPKITVDKDFEYVGEIIKSYVDASTGRRHIVGAASGLEEDRDGERMSKRAIENMVRAINNGGVKVTAGTHDQNWMTEIGDVVKAHIDPKTDQLMIDSELPPEGADALADKAWTETHKRRMSWSVGGKLQAAYHELTDTGKKRKVLDLVDPRHMCLTDKPAYQHGFAQAVAKTWDDPEPEDDEFTEEVEKDLTTGSWASSGGSNSGQDSSGSGERNAGTRGKTKKPSTDEKPDGNDEDDDDDKHLPDAESRHLSCPNCGHEFAAELPADMTPGEREADDKKPSDTDPEKSTEAIMDLKKQLDELGALVAKHVDGENPEHPASKPTEAPVEKTSDETGPTAVEKMLAASHAEHEQRLGTIEKTMGEALSLIGENLKSLQEKVGQIPVGRKSVALVRGRGDVAAHDIGKTTDDGESADDGSLHTALLNANRQTYGIS